MLEKFFVYMAESKCYKIHWGFQKKEFCVGVSHCGLANFVTVLLYNKGFGRCSFLGSIVKLQTGQNIYYKYSKEHYP